MIDPRLRRSAVLTVAERLRKQGWSGGPLHAVGLPDGTKVTLQNVLLAAALEAGLQEIPTLTHHPDEPLPLFMARDFVLVRPIRELADGSCVVGGRAGEVLFRRGRRAATYGEAALFRAVGQADIPDGAPVPFPWTAAMSTGEKPDMREGRK
ncbi:MULTISPECIES: hypothetical protein [Protofrankia]|uniref:hypothetical protein n=1 Tax=Protofrankia TaxID=2994361 RepID=UPI001115496B|nr:MULTISPECIES: hypothetical protein [Protofrankia]